MCKENSTVTFDFQLAMIVDKFTPQKIKMSPKKGLFQKELSNSNSQEIC